MRSFGESGLHAHPDTPLGPAGTRERWAPHPCIPAPGGLLPGC